MSAYLEKLRQLDRAASDPIARLKSGDKAAMDDFEPVDLQTRFTAKMKTTTDGARKLLEQRYGRENVEDVGGGNFAIRRTGAKPLLLEGAGNMFAEFGKDILDILPEAAEGVAAGIGGALGAAAGAAVGGVGAIPGGMAGAAAGATLARSLRQLGADQSGGEDEPGRLDFEGSGARRGLDAGVQGVIAGLGEGTAQAVAPAVQAAATKVGQGVLNTVSGVRRLGAGARGTEAAADALAGGTSARPRLDQITQGPDDIARGKEMARLDPKRFREAELAQSTALSDDTGKAVARLGDDLGPEESAGRALSSYDKGERALVEARQAASDTAFTEARRLAGDRKVIAPEKTKAVVAELLDQYGATKTGLLQQLAAKLDAGFSVGEIQTQLAMFGKGSRGGLEVVGTLDRAGNSSVSKRLFAALADDLDTAAANPLVGRGPGGQFTPEAAGQGARALKEARAQHHLLSEAIDNYHDNTIASMIKRAVPDADAAGFVAGDVEKAHGLVNQIAGGTLGDRDVGRIFKVLDEVDPASSGSLKRAVFDKVMARGEGDVLTKEALESGGSWYDAQNVAKAMLGPNNKRARLVALVGSEDHPTIQALDAVARFGQRIGAVTKEAAKQPEQASRGHKIGALIGAGAAAWKSGMDPLSTAGGAAAGAAVGGAFSKAADRVLNRAGIREAFLDPVKAGILRDAFSAPPEAASHAIAQLAKLEQGMARERDEEEPKDEPNPGSRLLSLLGSGGTGKL